MVQNEPTKDMIEDLRENANLIRTLSESFPAAARSLQIVTCRELLETATMQLRDGIWKRTGPKEMMVSETSACLYLPNEERIPIYANHSMIAKLGGGPESHYNVVRDHVASHCRAAPSVVRRRLLKAEGAAALYEIYQLAHFVYATVCRAQKSPPPVTQVKDSIKSQVLFLEHFAAFLFDDDLAKVLEDPDLSINHSQDVVDSLRQLNDVFSSYRTLAHKYYEPYRRAVDYPENQTPFRELQLHKEGALDLSISEIFGDSSSEDALFQDHTLTDLIRRCRESTRRLEITLAYASLRSFRSPNEESSEKFRKTMELCGTIPAKMATRQRLLTQVPTDDDIEPLEGRLEKYDVPQRNSNLQFARFFRKDGTTGQEVIVEYRKYEADPRLEGPNTMAAIAQRQYLSKLKRNMRQLAALLRESSFDVKITTEGGSHEEEGIGAFRCLGFVEEPDRYQLAYVFEIPEGMTAHSLATLYSLSTFIDSEESQDSSGQVPPASDKLQIARVLCQNILYLHASGWVHKNIRSQNIILAPVKLDAAFGDSGGIIQNYTQYLKGFEFSRPDLGKSSGRADFNPEHNLYRHPERQNVPDTRFMKEHDLYAVGVVLLEIGLWTTIPRLFHKHIEAARQDRPFPQPITIQNQLLKLAQKLPASLGEGFKAAVSMCLTGDFGVEKDDKQQANLGLAFREHVLDVLEARLKLSDVIQ
ncbi:MAG: hypothetical protein L6R42_000730 [Xanthoria sp. 1 TBL-2021]|nr:MAG: hypothetical protein L6R42_000730 [Xanthoria sp. 1 TBL-2021]